MQRDNRVTLSIGPSNTVNLKGSPHTQMPRENKEKKQSVNVILSYACMRGRFFYLKDNFFSLMIYTDESCTIKKTRNTHVDACKYIG